MRYKWPRACVVSNELQDLVAHIFQPLALRIAIEDIVDHPWITSNGQLESIHVSSPVRSIDAELLKRCAELGLPHAQLEDSLLRGEHNLLTATYHMLEAQKEAVQRRQGSNVAL